MSEPVFFTQGFDQMRIDFNNNPHPWVLKEKVLERKTQLDQRQFNAYNAASEAWAVFICENLDDPSEKAIIKIYMQIPYMGSEFSPPQFRQRQALELEGFAKRELVALKLFTEKACRSTPRLLGYKVDTQGPQDLVPGGFLVYLLIEKLPGHRLKRDAFWSLDETERADIRQEFKTAWINCYDAGLVLSLGTCKNIMWDAPAKRLHFTGFRDTRSSEDYPGGWDDQQWEQWGLLKPPSYLVKPSTAGEETESPLIPLRDGSMGKISDFFKE